MFDALARQAKAPRDPDPERPLPPEVEGPVAVAALSMMSDCARLKALIVPEPGCEVRPDELRRFARERLIHYKVPRFIEIPTSMPRSATGKIFRKDLESEVGGPS